MQIPMQVTFRDVPQSDAVEAAIREKAEKLQQFYRDLITVRAVVGAIQRHHHKGKRYNIRLDISVPGGEIVINRDQAEDIYVAIRDAFDAAKRKLEDYGRKQRGEVKSHEVELSGRIARLFPQDGYGFIESADGREFYFHRYNVVHPDFEHLQEGALVHFIEEAGPEGLHANRVHARGQ